LLKSLKNRDDGVKSESVGLTPLSRRPRQIEPEGAVCFATVVLDPLCVCMGLAELI
jgi:hypothetical protein